MAEAVKPMVSDSLQRQDERRITEMLPTIYDLERTARDLSQTRLKEAENERRAHLAIQAAHESRSCGKQSASQAQAPSLGILASRIVQLLRG